MPYTPTTWADDVTPVDAVNLNKIEAGVDVAHALIDDHIARSLGRGTGFPGGAADGEEFVLTDSLTAPTYNWKFRYNAGSASAYKWEFIGGAPAWSVIDANEVVNVSGAWGDPATVGPTFTVPRTGDYHLEWFITVNSATTNILVYCGPAIGAATPLSTAVQMIHTIGGLGWNHTFGSHWRALNLTAGNVLRLRYQGSAVDTYWSARRLTVLPVRVF